MTRIFLTGGSGFIGGEITKIALSQGHEVFNLDLVQPHFDGHEGFWTRGDVRDRAALATAFAAFRPDVVVHLASDTDVQITQIEQFTTTIEGTRNVIDAVRSSECVKRFVHISTQFTVRPGITPIDEEHLEPYTVYGEAKAETERLVRRAGLNIPWIIVRPTIIWGPNHPSFRENIFKYISDRSYLHPTGSKKIMRAFGYVTNTADQILQLALLGGGNSERRVFYVGDETIDYDQWADAFSLGLTGKKARRIPMWLLSVMGKVGDLIKRCGIAAPIDSGRAFRMSTSSAIDLSPTIAVTGQPNVSFDKGVRETLKWLQDN